MERGLLSLTNKTKCCDCWCNSKEYDLDEIPCRYCKKGYHWFVPEECNEVYCSNCEKKMFLDGMGGGNLIFQCDTCNCRVELQV